MRTITKWLCATSAGLALLGAAVPAARAQFLRPGAMSVTAPGSSPVYNPSSPLSGPYNPTPQAYAPLTNPYGGGYGGYGSNAYTQPATGATGSNPYAGVLAASGVGSSNPYSGWFPYPTDPYSGFLYGTADLIRAQGTLMIDQERARLMREVAYQAREQTRKLKFDTDMYIKKNTPTLTQEMAKNLASLVKRIQNNASPGEVEGGKAQNVLLADLAKYGDKKNSAGAVPIDEEVLRHINITGPAGGNLGVLRNDGQIPWPSTLFDVVPEQERAEIDQLAKGLFELAVEKKLRPNLLHDLEVRVQRLQDTLAKAKGLTALQRVDARRFLGDLQSAVRALGQGLAPQYAEWRQFIRNGKTVQEVAEWLNSRGLLVAPAVPGDEAAYQALHTALANYDVAVQAQMTASR
jgi:hypothetical protein